MRTVPVAAERKYQVEIGIDWNDKLKQLGHEEFAKFFLSKIEKYEHS